MVRGTLRDEAPFSLQDDSCSTVAPLMMIGFLHSAICSFIYPFAADCLLECYSPHERLGNLKFDHLITIWVQVAMNY